MAFVRRKRTPAYTPSTNQPDPWDRRIGPQTRRWPRREFTYQLVENERDGARVRQRVLAHLGEYPTVEAAAAAWEQRAARKRALAEGALKGRYASITGKYIRPDPELAARYRADAATLDAKARRLRDLAAHGSRSAYEGVQLDTLLGTTADEAEAAPPVRLSA